MGFKVEKVNRNGASTGARVLLNVIPYCLLYEKIGQDYRKYVCMTI